MREFGLMDQTVFADLGQKSMDASFDAEFPPNGTFLRQTRRGREYWYYRGYERTSDGSPGKSVLRYVGPTSDPEIGKRVERFAYERIGYRTRRETASRLRSAGFPSPSRYEGSVIDALSKAGIFRLRAVLVGSLAYQTYSGILGVRLPEAIMRTGDADLAQFFGISTMIDDRVDDLEAALKAVDPSFEPTFHPDSPTLVPGFASAPGFRVEFLTPNRGDVKFEAGLAPMPALGPGIGAQVLRYLDFLIHEPVRTVLLHEAGVTVMVPAPERYAVHKLIVSTLRSSANGREKAIKDVRQASDLLEAHRLTRRGSDVGFAWIEAWDRGPSWRRRLLHATRRLEDDAFAALRDGVAMAAELDNRPADGLGLAHGREGVVARLAGRRVAFEPTSDVRL